MYISIHLAGPISAYPNGTRAWHRSPKFSQCTNICISICFGLHYCEAETRINLEIAAVCFSLKYDFVVTSCSSYVCVTLFLSHPKYLHRFFFFFFWFRMRVAFSCKPGDPQKLRSLHTGLPAKIELMLQVNHSLCISILL